jgi:hypothetical protein
MKLQQQDYVAAERIQQELVRRMPNDPVISEFSKYLPAEALAQKHAANDYGDEYYDEEDEKEEKEEPEEPEEPEEQAEPEPAVEAKAEEEVPKEEEEGKESEYEDEEEGYGEEDYDEEGRYKWGKEGEDYEWYYKEDKEAFERGDPMPNTLNPPILLDQATIEAMQQ